MAVVEATNGSAGWSEAQAGVQAGESLILAMNAENAGAGVPGTANLAVTDQGPTNFAKATDSIFNNNDRHCEIQYLHDVITATHALSCGDTGLTSETWMFFRVSGLADLVEADANSNENASGTTHLCGAVVMPGPGIVIGVLRTATSKGTVTGINGFTALEGFGSRSIALYRIVTEAGTYTPGCTTSVTGASTGSAAGFSDVDAGQNTTSTPSVATWVAPDATAALEAELPEVQLPVDGSGSGWGWTHEGVQAGESVLLLLNAQGVGTAQTPSSNIDGATWAASTPGQNLNSRFQQIWHRHGCSAGDHTFSIDDTGTITSNRCRSLRVTGLANAVPVDIAAAQDAAQQGTHECGTVTVAGPALIVGVHRFDLSSGNVAGLNGFTLVTGSREGYLYRVVEEAGDYTPAFSTSNNVQGEGVAAAFEAGAAPAPGGETALAVILAHLLN